MDEIVVIEIHFPDLPPYFNKEEFEQVFLNAIKLNCNECFKVNNKNRALDEILEARNYVKDYSKSR